MNDSSRASLWIELCMFKIEHIFYPLLRKFDIILSLTARKEIKWSKALV